MSNIIRVSNMGVLDPPPTPEGGTSGDAVFAGAAEGPGAVVDLPAGFGQWVFMLFTNDFEILTPEGRVPGSAGAIVINSPSFPQWHRGTAGRFHNCWVHFDGEGVDAALASYGIKPDVVLRTVSPFRCLPILVALQRELNFRESYWEQAVHDLVHALFREIARQLELEDRAAIGEYDRLLIDVFHDLRIRLWNRVEHPWTVAELADEVGLSESRMSHLYRRYFRVSPIDDLITARLERAKALLVADQDTVASIADRCGFASHYYFSRLFRRRVGMTPTEYRTGGP
ncbi:MAG: helix-turn-helix transcriptional regulator [Spirochaetota bacterium]